MKNLDRECFETGRTTHLCISRVPLILLANRDSQNHKANELAYVQGFRSGRSVCDMAAQNNAAKSSGDTCFIGEVMRFYFLAGFVI
jgi:hypothetical protein